VVVLTVFCFDEGADLAIAIHEATEVQERHLRFVSASVRGFLDTASYGLPSGPRTTPFGSCFGASSSVVLESGADGATGIPVFCLTLQRKWIRIG